MLMTLIEYLWFFVKNALIYDSHVFILYIVS